VDGVKRLTVEDRRRQRFTRRQALLFSLAAPVASGLSLQPGAGGDDLKERVERLRARLRAGDRREGDDPGPGEDRRLTQWGWPNWPNWSN
jgi:hypothetical protein